MSAVMNSQELKGYQSQLTKARANLEVSQTALTTAQKQHSLVQKEVANLEKKIAELQEASAEPIVSEHAMLRWLERVEGIDLERVRTAILGGNTAESIKFAKSGRITKAGHTLVIKNNTVVTVE